jgi:hypothetical protein
MRSVTIRLAFTAHLHCLQFLSRPTTQIQFSTYNRGTISYPFYYFSFRRTDNFIFTAGPRHVSGAYSAASHSSGPGARFQVGFLLNKVAVGPVSSEYSSFLYQFSFHQPLHIHQSSYHRRYIVSRLTASLNNQIKQEVLGRSNRLLSFDMTRNVQQFYCCLCIRCRVNYRAVSLQR